MAMSRQKKLDKMDLIELAGERPKPEFHFRYGRTSGKMLFETKDLVTGYDEPLSKPLNFYGTRTEGRTGWNERNREDDIAEKYPGADPGTGREL